MNHPASYSADTEAQANLHDLRSIPIGTVEAAIPGLYILSDPVFARPAISVVIVVRDRWVELLNCLKSLDSQQTPPDCEVLVVDGESSTPVPDSVRNWKSCRALKYVRQTALGIAAVGWKVLASGHIAPANLETLHHRPAPPGTLHPANTCPATYSSIFRARPTTVEDPTYGQ